jgi:hypothetical protein
MEKSKGERGSSRRNCGVFMILVCGAVALMDGFKFFTGGTDMVWATGVIGMSLLISGIAKDVVAIAKHKIIKPA